MSTDRTKEHEKAVDQEKVFISRKSQRVYISLSDLDKDMEKSLLHKDGEVTKEERQAFESTVLQYLKQVNVTAIVLSVGNKVKSKQPPQFAEFILSIFLNKDEREYIIGDLEEKYYRWAEKRGIWKARALYWVDSLSMIQPRLSNLFYRFLKFLAKIGLLTWLTKAGGPAWLIDMLQKIVK